MSDSGDYLGEMNRMRISDAEIERLLTGSPDVGDTLRPLADLFAELRTDVGDELADDTVAAFVAAASTASVAPSAASPVGAGRRGRSLLQTLRRRAATATVAATVFLGGTGGLAVAADGAKPGDALYGIDRALEAVGIGAGAESERLSEAEALVASGELHLGLQHAAESLEASDSVDLEASEALMDAAERVRAAGADPSVATREGVAGLLAYLSENVGNLNGAHIAELAVQIGGPEDSPPVPPPLDSPEPPGPPAQSPADPPGLSDRDPGPPEGVDPPGLSDRDPGPPEGVDPPGLSDRDPGPPDDVPADPPGQSDKKPPKATP